MLTTTTTFLLLLAAQTAAPSTDAPTTAAPTTEAPTETAPATMETPTTVEPEPPPRSLTAATALAQAEERLQNGAALEAAALILRDVKSGAIAAHDADKAATLLARAADALEQSGDLKAAAVAADAGWALEGTPVRPRVALLVMRYARSIEDSDAAGARALAERALVADPDNTDAAALAAELEGVDSWTTGHLTLGAGVGLALLSSAALVWGLDVERRLKSSVHDTAEVDALLLQRGVAAGVTWPGAVGSVVATGLGLALIMQHHPGPAAVLPSPFAPLPEAAFTPDDGAVAGGGR